MRHSMKHSSRFLIGALSLACLLSVVLISRAASDKNAATNNAIAAGLKIARSGACSANLKDGNVLIAGGRGANGTLAAAETFSAKTGSRDASPMQYPREDPICASLPD